MHSMNLFYPNWRWPLSLPYTSFVKTFCWIMCSSFRVCFVWPLPLQFRCDSLVLCRWYKGDFDQVRLSLYHIMFLTLGPSFVKHVQCSWRMWVFVCQVQKKHVCIPLWLRWTHRSHAMFNISMLLSEMILIYIFNLQYYVDVPMTCSWHACYCLCKLCCLLVCLYKLAPGNVLTLTPAWISNYTHYKVWDEITYPFTNFNGSTVEFWKWIRSFIPHLTHWGRVTHICISKLTIIGSDNGLSPGRRQAIIWTNAGILLIGF